MSIAAQRPLRILELRSAFAAGGGPEKTILLGAQQADSAKYLITVCYIRDLRDQMFELTERAGALGVDYVEVFERNSFDPGIWPQLRRIVRERRIDIVHAHEYKTTLLALLLGWADGVIPFATSHGWVGQSQRELLYYAADKRLLSLYPQVIAVSEDIRQELIRTGSSPGRIVTVVNSIDHQKFRRDESLRAPTRAELGMADDDLLIGAVGRLERQKRFDHLIETFVEVAPAHANVHLCIAGDGSLRDDLAAQVAATGLGARCRLLGHRSDIVRLYHAFDILVQASDYEGTPNVVLEAMAHEVPVVATAAGGTEQLMRDGVHGYVVPIGDRPALARAMAAAIEDSERGRAMAVAARRRVEGPLSFATRMRRLEGMYDELAARMPRRPGRGRRWR